MSKKETYRLQSLDMFRGLIICMMIVVGASGNYAHTFKMLDHASWIGYTPTDFIFPSFLFIMGFAQSFSVEKLRSNAGGWRKVFRRFLLLFLLGLVINTFPFLVQDNEHIRLVTFKEIRVMGVLQRLAIGYLITSFLEVRFRPRILVNICLVILILYACLFQLYNGAYSVVGNPIARLDVSLLGEGHMYTEQGKPFDPEGLLSTLPSLVNIISGYLLGIYLKGRSLELRILMNVMVTGSLFFIVGYLLSFGDPISKKLWTSSFTLINIAWDVVLLTVLIYIVDVCKLGVRGLSFFIPLGRNPIFIYVLSEILMKLLVFPWHNDRTIYATIYDTIFIRMGLYWGAFVQAFTYMLLCWFICWWMDKKRIYITI